jgi:hypothetical protein
MTEAQRIELSDLISATRRAKYRVSPQISVGTSGEFFYINRVIMSGDGSTKVIRLTDYLLKEDAIYWLDNCTTL